MKRFLALLLALAPAACAVPGPTAAPIRWHAVLVAADGSLPVWDNAVTRMAGGLNGTASVQRFSAAANPPPGTRPALLQNVAGAIADLRPAPGEGCLIFVTAHGAPQRGLAFVASRNFLGPGLLNAALDRGCGDAPTVVIASGCYTGNFIEPPLARTNRIILTAARPDRPSFGCGAGFTYTVFDECVLNSLDSTAPAGWTAVSDATIACVEREEARLGAQPSGPQRSLGEGARNIPVPWGGLRSVRG
ncbi:C13 family peptidase [Muricoccus radiodurans]|uniref:C13 family peptidase n=1 Tax=Muricoccus radiodurans TaxID=2231721 RepID=UPI003CF11AF4